MSFVCLEQRFNHTTSTVSHYQSILIDRYLQVHCIGVNWTAGCITSWEVKVDDRGVGKDHRKQQHRYQHDHKIHERCDIQLCSFNVPLATLSYAIHAEVP